MPEEQLKKFSLFKSFSFAFSGIWQALKDERNLKIHFIAGTLVIFFGFLLGIPKNYWSVLVLLIATIFSAELFNSAVEGLCNLLKTKLNLKYEETTFIRDASAGAVLVLAISAVIIGCLIFLS